MIRFIILLLFLSIGADQLYADKATVFIDFNLENVATSRKKPGMSKLYPYKRIQKEYANIYEKTVLNRTVKINWEIINYKPNINLKSAHIRNAYHLFDLTWYRESITVKYKDKNGEVITSQAMPTGFKFKPHSIATIKGYGDYEVLISPTVAPPGGITIGGGGELRGEFKNRISKEIVTKDYIISIIEYPVTKAVYLILDNEQLFGKNLELSGDIILGDSAIETKIEPFIFPFDKYLFDIIYTSYYPAKVQLSMQNIKELGLAVLEDIRFDTDKKQKNEINMFLLRTEPFRKFVLLIIPLLLLLFLVREPSFFWRITIYIVTIIIQYICIPTVKNVPVLNFLSLSLLIFSLIILCSVEIILKVRHEQKNLKT